MTNITIRRMGEGHVADWGAGPRSCSVGRSGIAVKEREGDGVTPKGSWALRRVLYRADRMTIPATRLPIAALAPGDGWCDDPADPRYNTQIRLPASSGAETMWREDPLYDIVIVVGYNDEPAIKDKGSAIFIHIARENYRPTEGCVGLARDDLIEALAQFSPGDRLLIP